MPTARKNIYVRAEDATVWERAEQLAGESLSQLIADQLRRYVAERDAQLGGFERLVVEADGPRGVRKVAFYGRWLTERIWDGDMHFFRVALTRRGAIAVTDEDQAWGHEHGGIPLGHPPTLKTYESLEAASKDGVWPGLLNAAATALGTEFVEELDI